MTVEQGVQMLTVLMQTISALLLVYGAVLALIYTFGKADPAPEADVSMAPDYRARLAE